MTRKDLGPENVDAAYFQDLIRSIHSHNAWQTPDQAHDIDRVAEQAVENPVELWLDHSATNSNLRFSIPSKNLAYAAEGTLIHSFEPRQRSNVESNQFLYELSEAHCRIVETFNVEYVTTLADPNDILKIAVPYQYQQSVLHHALDNADRAAKKTEELHNKILDLISNYP